MCGVGAKSVAHLMKFHLLQSEVVKVKFLMNSNMTLTVLNLHQKTDQMCNKILKVRVTTTRSKVKSRSHHDAAHLQAPTNVPTNHQLPTHYGFRDIARTRFYRSRSLRQGQRSNQGQTMTLHTYNPLTNVPTKYQLPTPYGFRDIAQTIFYRSRSLQQGQRSNQGQTMTLHTYTP